MIRQCRRGESLEDTLHGCIAQRRRIPAHGTRQGTDSRGLERGRGAALEAAIGSAGSRWPVADHRFRSAKGRLSRLVASLSRRVESHGAPRRNRDLPPSRTSRPASRPCGRCPQDRTRIPPGFVKASPPGPGCGADSSGPLRAAHCGLSQKCPPGSSGPIGKE